MCDFMQLITSTKISHRVAYVNACATCCNFRTATFRIATYLFRIEFLFCNQVAVGRTVLANESPAKYLVTFTPCALVATRTNWAYSGWLQKTFKQAIKVLSGHLRHKADFLKNHKRHQCLCSAKLVEYKNSSSVSTNEFKLEMI